MSKKLCISSLLLAIILTLSFPVVSLAKGGGHTEPVGNNLSFPVIWSEGTKLTLPGTLLNASLTVPYAGDIIEPCPIDYFAYAQKTEGNVWQAENIQAEEVVTIDEIDWGDSLESVDMKIGRPVRVELSLYKLLTEPMVGYKMNMIANPSSPDEVQGVCAQGNPSDHSGALKYNSFEATVYTPDAKLLIQKVTGESLTWNALTNKWEGDIEAPIAIIFAGELNVGGKVIYGLSQGGWKPTSTGIYRITFYMPPDGNTVFDTDTVVRTSIEGESLLEEEMDAGSVGIVVWDKNLTYIDITVVAGGGK